MKRSLVLLILVVSLAPISFAQNDHLQAGVYADYFRLSQTKTDFAGVGARFGFHAYKAIMLEAEMSYDFNRAITAFIPSSPSRVASTTSFSTIGPRPLEPPSAPSKVFAQMISPAFSTRAPVSKAISALSVFASTLATKSIS